MSSMANLPYALVALLLVGCVTSNDGRYLTLEEDQALQEKCEADGCVVVPTPLFKQIIEALKGGRYAGS